MTDDPKLYPYQRAVLDAMAEGAEMHRIYIDESARLPLQVGETITTPGGSMVVTHVAPTGNRRERRKARALARGRR